MRAAQERRAKHLSHVVDSGNLCLDVIVLASNSLTTSACCRSGVSQHSQRAAQCLERQMTPRERYGRDGGTKMVYLTSGDVIAFAFSVAAPVAAWIGVS